ncbi:hypothetical protein Z043_118954, partial [Scleropages formosus]
SGSISSVALLRCRGSACFKRREHGTPGALITLSAESSQQLSTVLCTAIRGFLRLFVSHFPINIGSLTLLPLPVRQLQHAQFSWAALDFLYFNGSFSFP